MLNASRRRGSTARADHKRKGFTCRLRHPRRLAGEARLIHASCLLCRHRPLADRGLRPGSLSLPKTRFVRTDVIRPRLHVQRRLPAISRPASPNCLFFIQLYRWFLSILKAMTIIQPETLVRWEFSGGIKTLGSSSGDGGVGKAARRGTTRPFLRER